jgi:hypothetical protein
VLDDDHGVSVDEALEVPDETIGTGWVQTRGRLEGDRVTQLGAA